MTVMKPLRLTRNKNRNIYDSDGHVLDIYMDGKDQAFIYKNDGQHIL